MSRFVLPPPPAWSVKVDGCPGTDFGRRETVLPGVQEFVSGEAPVDES